MKTKIIFLPVLVLFLGACSTSNTNQETVVNNATTEKTTKIDTNQDSLLNIRANELAQKFIITDGHVDLPYRLWDTMEDVSKRTEKGDFDFERAKKGGLNAPFMSIYIPASYQKTGGAKLLADSLIDMVNKITTDFPDKFAMASNTEEVKSHFESGKISFPMGIENGAAVEDKLENVKHFYNRGVRYITLTHGKDNLICDSSYDSTHTWNGLSPFGEKVVAKMNATGIMVDISHVSDSTFYQVMKLSKAPVIASHSSCRHFTPDFERNMSDDMIRELAKNGGVIQINFGSTFLTKKAQDIYKDYTIKIENWTKEQGLKSNDPKVGEYAKKLQETVKFYEGTTINDAVDHIEHVVGLVGIEHVGLGSDFDGVGDSLPEGLKDVSDYPNLIFQLLKRGYTEEQIEKICYKNVFRVWDKVAEIAEEL
jgi:membrane dipeptidase